MKYQKWLENSKTNTRKTGNAKIPIRFGHHKTGIGKDRPRK
jgi:hypothetical protein